MYSPQQIKLSILFTEIYKASYFWRRIFYHFSCENYKTIFFVLRTSKSYWKWKWEKLEKNLKFKTSWYFWNTRTLFGLKPRIYLNPQNTSCLQITTKISIIRKKKKQYQMLYVRQILFLNWLLIKNTVWLGAFWFMSTVTEKLEGVYYSLTCSSFPYHNGNRKIHRTVTMYGNLSFWAKTNINARHNHFYFKTTLKRKCW